MSPRITPWSVDEVQTFLCLVADGKIQRELKGAKRTEKVFQEVAELLAAHGYQRTFQQCREKLKKLKSDYRSIKDHPHKGRSGANRKSWKWFDQMDAIYGPSYTNNPPVNEREGDVDSATALSEYLEDDHISISGESSMSPDDASLVPEAASTPAPVPAAEPSPTAAPKRSSQQNRRKRHRDHDHVAVLREMHVADVEQQELNREQRERHVQMALEDAVRARELEAALRREENAETAAFNQAFFSTLRQLVQALSGRHDPVPLPLD